jgi:16S rRNA C967 or C1407 C5-methylase (RsmB/RsmF family)/NOL1/NOP2/fmu family ribosome biogenesis protein
LADLPPDLVSSLQQAPGFSELAFVEAHATPEQVVSVRLNPRKMNAAFAVEQLEKVPWSTWGYYLPQRPSFTADPLFHAGVYYVQEASSMFLEKAIRQSCDINQRLRVLDLCAAPGGKSTLIQSLISPGSLLVANEVIKTRVNILTENVTKWGASNVVVTNNDPHDFKKLPGFFDLIVIDAPCSGSGLFRKDPRAIEEWSLNNVALCSQRQQRILDDVLPSLKPGGTLIYSTCSYSVDEDEAILDWLISNQYDLSPFTMKLSKEWNIVESFSPVHKAPGYRFYPDKLKGEGFYISVLVKGGDVVPDQKNKHKLTALTPVELQAIKPFLQSVDGISFLKQHEEILAFPAALASDILLLKSVLYIKKAGVKIGSVMQQQLVPDHELALSEMIHQDVPGVETDQETALQYLRRQDVTVESNRKGWALIKYKNTTLGWIKILSNRINNYYPKAWRILNK